MTRQFSQPSSQKFGLAIDGNEANVKNRVGSNAYAFEIIRHLYFLTKNEPQAHITVLLSSPPLEDLPLARKNWTYRVFGPKPFWTQWALPLHLLTHREDYQVLFCPGHYAPRISVVPYVNSIMDLAYLKYPSSFAKKDFLQLKSWTDYSVKNAAKVVVISQFTLQEVKKIFNKPSEDLILAYPSISQHSSRYNKAQFTKFCDTHHIKPPYFLYLGTIQPRKNLLKMIDAFEKMLQPGDSSTINRNSETAQLQLVIAGKVGWLATEILQKIKSSPVSDKIILTGFVPNQLKTPLYLSAQAVLMLSPYEGFGMPALEALAAGAIPVVANTSSLPEVVGPAGILVNPDQVGSITNGMLQALYLSKSDKVELLAKGKTHLQKFSWDKSAKIIFEALQKIALQHPKHV